MAGWGVGCLCWLWALSYFRLGVMQGYGDRCYDVKKLDDGSLTSL